MLSAKMMLHGLHFNICKGESCPGQQKAATDCSARDEPFPYFSLRNLLDVFVVSSTLENDIWGTVVMFSIFNAELILNSLKCASGSPTYLH